MTPRQLLGRVLTALRRPSEEASTPLPVVDKYGRKIVSGAGLHRGQIVRDQAGELWFVVETLHFGGAGKLIVNGGGYARYPIDGAIYIVEEEAT